jgi:dCMP deaminase
MKQKYIDMYMDWAARAADLSHARRLQVGAVIVKEDRVISMGYNGMPAGWDNNCEIETVELYSGYEGAIHRTVLKTKPEVLHAETNAIAKLAKSTESGDGAVLFVTHMPCLDCAKLIFQSGICSVFYRDSYRNTDGVTFLEQSGITVTQIQQEKDAYASFSMSC